MKKLVKSIGWLIVAAISEVAIANNSAIVIFDGSGSMKAKVDGKAKIDIARSVIGDLAKDWNEDIDLGLMVYGHRTKSCDDIEMVIPVAKADSPKLISAVQGIVPKGETPIGASLKQAAEELKYTESPTTVILISDGEESCQSDPCEVAKQLESAGVNFTAHVIGFDVSGAKQAKALEQLKCVADSTGGKFFEAKNADGLKTALAETAKVVAQPAPQVVEKTEPIKPALEGDIIWEDKFDRDELGEAYEVIDPDPERMALSEGQLILVAATKAVNRVQLKQPLEGDFAAIVKVSADLEPHNYAGLKFVADETSSVGLWLGCFNPGFNVDVAITKYIGDTENQGLKRSEIRCDNAEILTRYLKIEKKGFNLRGYSSIDGSTWDYIGQQTLLKKTGNIEFGSMNAHIDVDATFNLDDFIIKKLQ
ncbi:MAG: VWA domain-containing protein [Thiolinea sp.]